MKQSPSNLSDRQWLNLAAKQVKLKEYHQNILNNKKLLLPGEHKRHLNSVKYYTAAAEWYTAQVANLKNERRLV